MKYRFLALMILLSFRAYSQPDSLAKAISAYEDKTEILITNGRKLLLSNFLDNNLLKVAEVKNFLVKTENKDYIALYPYERWMLDYWTRDYADILQTTEQFDSTYYASFSYRIQPPYDLLERKVYEATSLNIAKLISNIDSSNLDSEKKDFLILNLRYINIQKEHNNYYQDTLNTLANAYLKKYPSSNYNTYIRRYIRYQLVASTSYFIMDMGFGGYFNSGQLYSKFGSSGLFSLGLAWKHERFNYILSCYLGSSKVKQDLVVENKQWTKGVVLDLVSAKLSFGYDILDIDRFRFSPNVGLVYTDYSPSQYNQPNEYIYSDLKNTSKDFYAYSFGFNYDISFKPRMNNLIYISYLSFIRLSYGINIPFKSYSGYNGVVNYFTISYGFGLRSVKREI
ncbi:MAG TPA: hypothetical protein VMW01_01590 [Williamwhitmania sp.]|nr:hypothetical protein [Williamwhitmania sp.]